MSRDGRPEWESLRARGSASLDIRGASRAAEHSTADGRRAGGLAAGPQGYSPPMSLPRRISVVGSTGSGKTTFGHKLARRIGVAHIELDALAWGPNWTLVPVELFKERVSRAVEGDAWVIDGNYGGRGARDLVWPRADTVIWLDPPLGVIFARLFDRAVRRIRSRQELW